MGESEMVWTRLPPDVKAELEQKANGYGMNSAEMLRSLIMDFLGRHSDESPIDNLNRRVSSIEAKLRGLGRV